MAGRVTYFGDFFMIRVSYEVCERDTFLSKWWEALPVENFVEYMYYPHSCLLQGVNDYWLGSLHCVF